MTRPSTASRRRRVLINHRRRLLAHIMTRPSTASRRHRNRCEETMQNWSELPEGLLHTILMCLCSLVDFISFSSVCRSWRAVASHNTSLFPPLLLRPTVFERTRLISSLRLLDPTTPSFSTSLSRNSKKFESFHLVSFSHGHLLGLSPNRVVTLKPQNHVVILNPFTSDELCSPLLPYDHKISSTSIMLTSPLPSPDCGILLYESSCLFYWRIGSPSWSCHYCPTFQPGDRMTVVTMQGKFYTMDCLAALYELDLSPELQLRPLAVEGLASVGFSISEWHSLVDCGGELLLLRMVPNLVSVQLDAFQLDLSVNMMSWVKKETLGNWAIFVGWSSHMPGIAVENPERWGGRSNCVYFATMNANGWAAIKLGDIINLWDPESWRLFTGNFGWLPSEWFRPGF